MKNTRGWIGRRGVIATIAKAQLVGTNDTVIVLNIDIFQEGELQTATEH